MIKRFVLLLVCCCVLFGAYTLTFDRPNVPKEVIEDEDLVAERDRPERHDEERQTLYDKNRDRIREEEQEGMRNFYRYDNNFQEAYPQSYNPYYPQ